MWSGEKQWTILEKQGENSIAFSGILAGPKRSDEAGLCVHTAHVGLWLVPLARGDAFLAHTLSLIPTYVNSLIHISRTATRRHLKTPVTMVFFQIRQVAST